MATITRVSLEEYLTTHCEPECELIDGKLCPKPMGTPDHMRAEKRLLKLLEIYEAQGLGEALSEVSIRVGNDIRIPDVTFLGLNARVENGILVEPPILCIEVLSPSQAFSEVCAKCESYHAAGVPLCWIIDPVRKLAWEYHNATPLALVSAELRAAQLTLNLSELFA